VGTLRVLKTLNPCKRVGSIPRPSALFIFGLMYQLLSSIGFPKAQMQKGA
jgi:hypothetical protein